MKLMSVACAAAALTLGLGRVAAAEEWKDYTPVKGVWMKTMVHVDAFRMDDYLVALKKTWVPEMENLKKHGLIDRYFVQVAVNQQGPGPNVTLGEHYVSMAAFDPDRARDVAINREEEAMLPKAQSDALMAERGKYRTFMGQEMWEDVDLSNSH
jgi:hypothetical protein